MSKEQKFRKVLEEKLKKMKNEKNSIKNLRNRDFSEYCEYAVAFELQRLLKVAKNEGCKIAIIETASH